MEMEKAASWWNELPFDFQAEICARMPVESLFSCRMICKQWNDFLCSNYFLTRWGEASLNNGDQSRLLVCDFRMEYPCMAFCFYTRTWINSCLDLSFLQDGDWRDDPDLSDIIYFKESVGGLILVGKRLEFSRRLINPYTRTFLEIPASQASRDSYQYFDCIVVDEKDNDTTYKVAAVVEDENGQQLVEIYEPSQKRWKLAGYLPENVVLQTFAKLFYCNGTFYAHCLGEDARGNVDGIGCFTIPLEEGSGSALTPNPIPMHFAPFPRKLRKGRRSWRMVTCLSRLLVIFSDHVSVRHAGRQRKRKHVITVWEFKFKSEEDHPVAWEWVKIAQMPSSFQEECMVRMKGSWDCRGVGDHICFAPAELFGDTLPFWPDIRPSEVENVSAYNLIRNTWSWLPSCPFSRRRCVGWNRYEDAQYAAINVEPNLLIKFQ